MLRKSLLKALKELLKKPFHQLQKINVVLTLGIHKTYLFIVLSLRATIIIQKTHTTATSHIYPSFSWSSKALSGWYWVTPMAWTCWMADDITSRLLVDVTMMMVTLAVVHGQIKSGLHWWYHGQGPSYLGYWLMLPLRQWPWQHNTNVQHRYHSHHIGPTIQIKCILWQFKPQCQPNGTLLWPAKLTCRYHREFTIFVCIAAQQFYI